MNELTNGLAVSLHGSDAQRVVDEALAQIGEWGLSMPNVRPLVLDFGLGDFRRTGEIEFWIANELSAGYCGKFIFVQKGQTCPRHMHKQKVETFFMVIGEIAVQNGDSVQTLVADNYFADTRIPIGGNYKP